MGRCERVDSARPADIRDALGRLAELLRVAHVMAGWATRAPTPNFGMAELTRRACVAEGGGIPLETGKKLLGEGFRRLRRLAALKRTRSGEPPSDIGAVFARVISHDYKDALRTDLVVRAADVRIAAAGLDVIAGGGAHRPAQQEAQSRQDQRGDRRGGRAEASGGGGPGDGGGGEHGRQGENGEAADKAGGGVDQRGGEATAADGSAAADTDLRDGQHHKCARREGRGAGRHRGLRVPVPESGAAGAPQRSPVRLAGAFRPLQQTVGLLRKLHARGPRRSGQGGAKGCGSAGPYRSDRRAQGAPSCVRGRGQWPRAAAERPRHAQGGGGRANTGGCRPGWRRTARAPTAAARAATARRLGGGAGRRTHECSDDAPHQGAGGQTGTDVV
eukprot:6194699-Pleurochrysis_carterae.AAC.1